VAKDNRFLLIFLLALIPTLVAVAFLLTAIFGPSDNGLRCERLQDHSECQIRQTRFFGLYGNSAFAIQQSTIRGATSVCSTAHMGGRAGPSCIVYLILDSGPYRKYPVLSYALAGQADASAKKLNDYFNDKSAASVEVKEDILTPVLIFGLPPVMSVVLLVGLHWWRVRSKPP
jgi:hypothetical protein